MLDLRPAGRRSGKQCGNNQNCQDMLHGAHSRKGRIGVLERGELVARGENSGMVGVLTFFLRQLHEWSATPARG